MAKKEATVSLIDTFSEFKDLKNIDRTTMVSVLEESFRSVIAKMFGTDENYDVIVNPDKGDFEIWRNREVVADDELTNPNLQISLTEARKIDASYEVGEEVTDEVIFEKFGRRAILNLRQTLASKILELEKDSLYNKYIDKVGTIIAAEVYQIWKKEILLLDDEGNELLLPKTEQIPSDFYRKGETARAVVARVDNKNNNPKIILSRTSPMFLQRLFEQEVPEINDGLITIKKIARIPGERAKEPPSALPYTELMSLRRRNRPRPRLRLLLPRAEKVIHSNHNRKQNLHAGKDSKRDCRILLRSRSGIRYL